MLAGVLPPDEGTASVAGFDMGRDPEGGKRHLSYMPQRFGLYEDLTVDENIRFYADLFGVQQAERDARSVQLLKAAGMSEFRGRLAGKLSGGMKQKLGLVCALIHKPQVILLDEPTTGVDPVSRRDFWAVLYSLLAEGVAIITSTAYLDEAERCHRVALLHEGQMLFCDTPKGLKERLPGGVLFVLSSDPRRVREALQGVAGISSLVLVGDGVRLVVEDMAKVILEVEHRLTAQKVPFESIHPALPTIEDLFVSSVEAHQVTR
jgi:ABC-2 type transport system ATP-binding protein